MSAIKEAVGYLTQRLAKDNRVKIEGTPEPKAVITHRYS